MCQTLGPTRRHTVCMHGIVVDARYVSLSLLAAYHVQKRQTMCSRVTHLEFHQLVIFLCLPQRGLNGSLMLLRTNFLRLHRLGACDTLHLHILLHRFVLLVHEVETVRVHQSVERAWLEKRQFTTYQKLWRGEGVSAHTLSLPAGFCTTAPL